VAHLKWYRRLQSVKLSESYEALLHLAAAIICWGKVAAIYG